MHDPTTRQKIRIYATSAALTAEVSPIMLKDSCNQTTTGSTLNLDVAVKASDGFDWSNKITIQLSENELPEFSALLMGYHDSMKAQRANKGIEIIRQDKRLFLKASKKGGALYALPIPTAAIFKLNVLALELLKEQNHTSDVNVIIASLRMFAKSG